MVGLLDFITKPLNPGRQEFDGFDIFLAERNVENQSWDYNYRNAYEYYRETGIDPYNPKSKHWISKFKHPLSSERYISDKEDDKWFDTIENKFVSGEIVAQQEIERLEYLETLPIEKLNEKR